MDEAVRTLYTTGLFPPVDRRCDTFSQWWARTSRGPQQVADVMAWLLGDGAARLTGQVIAVDGGFTTVRPLAK